MDEIKTMDEIDEQEYEAAMKKAEESQDTFVFDFRKPFVFEDESFDSLAFDFSSMTAEDSLAIEAELAAINQPALIFAFSGEYLIRLAMRACTTRRKDGRRLGIDAFKKLPIFAYARIRDRARSFLLRAES